MTKKRLFEIPYNFDIKLIESLKIFDPEGLTIACIYIPPFYEDYETILRGHESNLLINILTRDEYEKHIHLINSMFPNKLQLLLQKQEQIMSKEKLQYYINLGFSNFCVGNLEQAKIIKNIDSNFIVVGSISMRLTLKEINNNHNYENYFDYIVLHFPFCRNLNEIKQLTKKYKYILLVNAYCHAHCDGKHHWEREYKTENSYCPGRLGGNLLKWKYATRIRPMDLDLFSPYIEIFKIQDRGWPTRDILRDYILYSSDYSYYPEINYTERIYN
ncbi:MAG: hypothetical protein E7167_01130 [Firmicutes bacterium]|nr:hypothetical protein [Bacillota bacterium]